MKATFISGLLVGLLGIFVGASAVPWPQHVRLDAPTSMLNNGGRQETFVIRLPADRVVGTGAQVLGSLVDDPSVYVSAPAAFSAAPFLVEHYKLRDSSGSVVGLATRHWTSTGSGTSTSWVLDLPARGSFYLSARDASPELLRVALAGEGYREGTPWTGQLVMNVSDASTGAALLAGTGEFATFSGSFAETWTLTGVSARGHLGGTITLTTTVIDAP